VTLLAALLRVGGGLAAATLAGAAISRGFTSGLTRRERVAWSLVCGLLLQVLCLLVLLLFGIRPRAASLLLLEGVAAAAGWAYGRRYHGPVEARLRGRTPRRVVFLLASIAALAWLVFLVGSLADGMWATDFLANWGYKGKIVFLSSEVPSRLFEDPALYYTNRSYPLVVPLTFAALAAFAGEWNDQALALIYPASALATLLVLSGFLERRVSRLAGLTAATLSALCFFLYRPANAGTAEVPLALALVLACAAAGDVLQGQPGAAPLARLAVAALFCAGVKQEGTLFVLLLAAAIALRPREARAASRRFAAAALLLPVVLHWATLYLLRGSPGHREFDFTLLEPRRWAELPALFALVFGRLLGTEARQNAVPLLAVAVFLAVTRRGALDSLLPVFGAQLLCYAIEPVFSINPMWAIDSAFSRIVMTLFPAFTLVLGARWGRLLELSGTSFVRPPVERARA
jgi:hypothetical protein